MCSSWGKRGRQRETENWGKNGKVGWRREERGERIAVRREQG